MGYIPAYDTVIAGFLALSLVIVFAARAIEKAGVGHKWFAPWVQFISMSQMAQSFDAWSDPRVPHHLQLVKTSKWRLLKSTRVQPFRI